MNNGNTSLAAYFATDANQLYTVVEWRAQITKRKQKKKQKGGNRSSKKVAALHRICNDANGVRQPVRSTNTPRAFDASKKTNRQTGMHRPPATANTNNASWEVRGNLNWCIKRKQCSKDSSGEGEGRRHMHKPL
jgi:hypothetical protein